MARRRKPTAPQTLDKYLAAHSGATVYYPDPDCTITIPGGKWDDDCDGATFFNDDWTLRCVVQWVASKEDKA